MTVKNEAAAVLADMGLTVSDVVRIALTKIAKEKALPKDMDKLKTLLGLLIKGKPLPAIYLDHPLKIDWQG